MTTAIPDPDRADVVTPDADGVSPLEGGGRVLLVACGALAHEILHLKRINGWDHLDLACLPAILHNRPDRIPDAVHAVVTRNSSEYDRVCVVYADCGTGGALQRLCDRLGVEMIRAPHCYAFFEGVDSFIERDEMTAFYLTDFLVRQFDAFVWRPLGLDRHPELHDAYFGHYEALVYLAQSEDPALTQQAADHAQRLGLRFERRKTGYGELATTLEQWASQD
ncbi:DUF1638 domain-containing protein [Citreimonas salinaria]|uniref:DUF1638 domain-containing protein n=1 Tax=Citreimonas salinaria TaxID=321339 RepID=A0A1H3G6H7_9RHOB|nr:DUF1638 domain-containing protein [Citreimonas salinaria]SDX98942.1 Protein of unknown function [Citreimonas salinaria]